MATFRQAGADAARRGLTAERAVLEYFRADMSAGELGAGLEQFLDGYGVKQNPGRATLFERCVRSVTERGGARDPRAVCAAAGRRKLGQAEMTRRSVAGRKKNAALWQGFKTKKAAQEQAKLYREAQMPVRVVKRGKSWKVEGLRRKNPAELAAAGYEEFHGHPPELTVEVKKRVHFHRYLSGAGVLRSLVVLGIDGQTHTIKGFKGALLAFNEAMNQLFIEGGDQSVNLEDYGIRKPHELETLGKVKTIDYHTKKSHLGDEGGEATYRHNFRTTNENGRHVVVKVKRYPDLIYRVPSQQLEFAGGSYEIRREGIDF